MPIQIVACAIGEVVTIVTSASAAGFYGAVSDVPGNDIPASRNALVPGTTLTLGPWPHSKRVRIDVSSGSVTASASKPAIPFAVDLGKVEGFTGNRTLTIDDNGRLLRSDDASAVTLTVPNSLPEGYNVSISQWSTGSVTISPASGATSRSTATAPTAQYAVAVVMVLRNVDGVSAEYVVAGEVS